MNILAVDTAGKTAGVALLQDDRLLYEVYLDAGMTHSETLMPMIDTCLKTCGMTCADIDLYGVNAGPGGVHGQNVHTSTPSMVILRVFSSTRSMFTWIGCSSASRSAKFSLHSAATMAP